MKLKKNKLVLIVALAAAVISFVYIGIVLFDNMSIFVTSPPREKVTAISLDDLGSAAKAEGNIGIVTVFADDNNTHWDFSLEQDKNTRADLLTYTDIAAKWLTEKAEEWNKTLKFVKPQDENSDFYFETRFEKPIKNVNTSRNRALPEQWSYIDRNIDSKALTEKYSLDGMVYLFFLNYKQDSPSECRPFSLMFYNKPLDSSYELCIIHNYYSTTHSAPSTIAHEILHLFGAPDLYGVDLSNMNYGTTNEFVSYCNENLQSDIMLSGYVIRNGKKVNIYDRIEQDISPLTAYYIGWTDEEPPQVKEFGLVNSQHIKVDVKQTSLNK